MPSLLSVYYDGDGKQVKAVVGSVTTYYVGAHYQVENGVVTKFYFAGATRIAMRKNGTVSYLLGDHLGSTSITANSSGALVAELRYKLWGETRYTSGTTPTTYQFTGQRNEASFGLYFYNARWYDSAIGRFTSADSIVPAGVQGYDRYAYANNDPILYTDPTGHYSPGQIRDYLKKLYGNKWRTYYDAWKSDDVFWDMLLDAQDGDVLQAPTTTLGNGLFRSDGNGSFDFVGEHDLFEYQGYGPYDLLRGAGDSTTPQKLTLHPFCTNTSCPTDQAAKQWNQPIYDYSSGVPVYTGFNRQVTYQKSRNTTFNILSGDSVPWLIGGPVGAWILRGIPVAGQVVAATSALTALNNAVEIHIALTVNYEDKNMYIGSSNMAAPVSIQPPWVNKKDR